MVTYTPEVLAIIPARGGSKGIPGKNIKEFAGYPLIAWSIAAAQQARLVRRIVVSTDDAEIAAIARAHGAETPFMRPAPLAQDDTRDLPVFSHALQWLCDNEGYRPDIVVQLRPTSPLRPQGLVDEAVSVLAVDKEADCVRSVTPPSQNPFKMWTIRGGVLNPLLAADVSEPYNAPRQSLPVTYWQTGHVDVIRSGTILDKNSMTGTRILPVLVDSHYALDIDEQIHWRLAEECVREGQIDIVRPKCLPILSFAGIRLFVFDFDGVFTDNRVYVGQDGQESVSCSRADGLGIERLLSNGFEATVLSTEINPVVAARCMKLKLPVRQGVRNKGDALRELAREKRLTLDQIAFIGNDLNDIECLEMARLSMAPADAHPKILGMADVVLRSPGGHGAVREVCDLALAAHEQ
jgi:N-acylneuraminate cytidylyltransferase